MAMLVELQELDAANSEFELVATMTDLEDDKTWRGETGYIDAAMLARHLHDMKTPIFYCVGPGKFVSAMSEMLTSAGVEKASIQFEEFGGY